METATHIDRGMRTEHDAGRINQVDAGPLNSGLDLAVDRRGRSASHSSDDVADIGGSAECGGFALVEAENAETLK